jgi:hypothetical protein
MAINPDLTTLLKRYEALRSSGRSVTPEELCRDRPELLDELRQNLQILALLDSLLQERPQESVTLLGPGPAADEAPPTGAATTDPRYSRCNSTPGAAWEKCTSPRIASCAGRWR